MSIQNKLNRMRSHLHIQKEELELPTMEEVTIPSVEQWKSLNAEPFIFHNEHIFVRTETFPLHVSHGKYPFSDLFTVIQQWNETNLAHPLSAKGMEAEDLIFFDTETTGLHHGASNYVFLLGVAKVTKKEVVVTQYFLPGPGNEVALYERFLTDVSKFDHLVTYNGRSFDWPQVKNRHVFVRHQVQALPEFGHFDLLHASRRVFKHELEQVRLAQVEKHILGFNRTEDTPGFLAPALYQLYLTKQDPFILEGIFQHNTWDVLSLITLYIHLSHLLLNPNHKRTMYETYEIARWFETLQMYKASITFYEQIDDSNVALFFKKHYSMATIYKKHKQFDLAIHHFLQGIQSVYIHVDSCVELAKIYEHQMKDVEKAMYYTQLALRQVKENQRILREKRNIQDALQKRYERLQQKLNHS